MTIDRSSLLVDESTVRQLINMEDAIPLIDHMFKEMGHGRVLNPDKVTLDLGESGGWPFHDAFLNAMPAYLGSVKVAGQKFVGGFAGERAKLGLPFITALIILVDGHLGNFISVMDGTRISNMRTGAQAALAMHYILKNKHIKVGMFGAGQQARQVVHAISCLFEIDGLYVYDISPEQGQLFKEQMSEYVTGQIHLVDQPEQACQVDAIFTLTTAKKPIIKQEWVQKGTLIFPMGSYREIDDQLILDADAIVVDHVNQALNRGILKPLHNDNLITEADITATFSQLSIGENIDLDPTNQLIICIPIGMGATDVTLAYEVYQRALKANLGTRFNFTD